MKRFLLGLDIGGSKCAVVLGSLENQGQRITILAQTRFATAAFPAPQDCLTQLCRLAAELLQAQQLSQDDLAGIGISCGGPLDSRRGLICSPPNLPGWDEVPVREFLAQQFSCSCPVYLQNDANAGALAEWHWGTGQGCRNMLFLTFGTGLGAGLILDRRLYCGSNDQAGECGHLRLAPWGPVGYGKAGAFEGFCSGGGLAQLGQIRARELQQLGRPPAWCPQPADLPMLSAARLAEFALQGDAEAREVFRCSGEYLGRGLAMLVDILNPECIVIGGIFSRVEALLRPAMEQSLQAEALPLSLSCCRIVPAALQDKIGDYAALAVACGDSLPPGQ